ncbi:hypothetical protein SUGI_1155090 [Cryptomeria japonica]|nr:hypothetical protein SUGI_1155090 [Cryptomeria japonica]
MTPAKNQSRIDMEPKGTTWRIFSLKELFEATNNFDPDNKLGEGGFGSVYHGLLSDGSQIAVKRLKVLTSKTEMEFAVEVEILGRVKHKNLLSLRGYCAEGQERLIIYDYMPKSSLLAHLHGEYARRSPLDWPKRMNIAIGSAEGLAYLHNHGRYSELADPKLHGRYNLEELRRVIHAATACTQTAPAKRPTMSQLVNFLKGDSKNISMDSKQEENVKLDAIPINYEQEAHNNSGSNSARASIPDLPECKI